MTINTIIAHNWAILYSGDSTTKIRRKNSFSSSVTKKLSGLETTKRKKNEELSYHKKILDFWPHTSPKNFAQLIGSALIENGRTTKKLILFWILQNSVVFVVVYNSQLRCIIINATSIFDSEVNEGKSKLILKLMGRSTFFFKASI